MYKVLLYHAHMDTVEMVIVIPNVYFAMFEISEQNFKRSIGVDMDLNCTLI